eukprot:TRINITY_DN9834_c0_g1_i1.p1 TRINITY_DN9834_c0_g1~~TRINITY_DN9834_c0_g1_i1.p1  ORF type:complete len:220 (+),score=26.84 TRINITY_DN9834_c0_g1_i1:1-660(+)
MFSSTRRFQSLGSRFYSNGKKLKLYYFNLAARAEQSRLLLKELNIEFEDVHVDKKGLADLKSKPGFLPFGQLPLLEDGDLFLAQSTVILSHIAKLGGIYPQDAKSQSISDMIVLGAEDFRSTLFKAWYAPNKEEAYKDLVKDFNSKWGHHFQNLLKKNNSSKHFVGGSLTHADVAVFDALNQFFTVPGFNLDNFPSLSEFYNSVKQRPNISAYLSQRKY